MVDRDVMLEVLLDESGDEVAAEVKALAPKAYGPHMVVETDKGQRSKVHLTMPESMLTEVGLDQLLADVKEIVGDTAVYDIRLAAGGRADALVVMTLPVDAVPDPAGRVTSWRARLVVIVSRAVGQHVRASFLFDSAGCGRSGGCMSAQLPVVPVSSPVAPVRCTQIAPTR
jgi:hypothetical protein